MVRGFYLRLAAVLFGILGTSVFLASATMIPSYAGSSIKKNLAESKLAEQKAEPIPDVDQKTLSDLADLNKKLSIIEGAEKNQYSMTKNAVAELISKKMPDIKITSITYSNTAQGGKKITIQGIAPSRERLLSFSQALENDAAFQKVDVPVSNFVQGQNIPFFITLIPS